MLPAMVGAKVTGASVGDSVGVSELGAVITNRINFLLIDNNNDKLGHRRSAQGTRNDRGLRPHPVQIHSNCNCCYSEY